MAILKPFQLLEINIISAQDLEPVSKKMKTYAVAWVNRHRKLSSRVDSEGNANPTWNDKFVFRVDEEFLRKDTSAVMIEIYAAHWFRDTLVGTVRILVGNLIPPPAHPHSRHRQHYGGMRFVALQVRRPSGRPQGILNIGVALLDSSMRSMPLYTQLSASAVGFRDLMDDPNLNNHHQNNDDENNNNNQAPTLKPILRRSKSERSELIHFDNYSATNSSIVAIPKKMGTKGNGGSILSVSEAGETFIKSKNKKGKASSVISGAELREKPKQRGKKGKASSAVSDSIVSKETSVYGKIEKPGLKNKGQENVDKNNEKPGMESNGAAPANKVFDEKPVTQRKKVGGQTLEKPQVPTIGKPVSKFNGYEYGGPPKGSFPNGGKFVIGAPFKAHSIFSDSEVGPPPSEVAAMMAERKYPLDDNQSSVLDGWSLDESVEGLKSKLERWRMELPPLYDRGFSTSSYQSKSSARPTRRQADSSIGLFSCFGNICGYECQCICGKPPGNSNRFRSPAGTSGRSFL
ncbi:Calcium-dependent lipid-binding (CaLB domain) family protein [Forsythia ovata]|uniref:Calcium-dependent lipid-binding (CaLB domain) family protein n=1 Tax=Forsythia ovata TaxID=205694 RepID=A0ABD1V0N0_9LAMI